MDERENFEDQDMDSKLSLSYYSCPPVMQGMAIADSSNPSDVTAIYSAPEKNQCAGCMKRPAMK